MRNGISFKGSLRKLCGDEMDILFGADHAVAYANNAMIRVLRVREKAGCTDAPLTAAPLENYSWRHWSHLRSAIITANHCA